MSIRIRDALPADRDWILALAPRLHAFGPPPTRAREVMDQAVVAGLDQALSAPGDGTVVLVAEGTQPLGFVHIHGVTDFFTHEVHGHVSDLAVDPAAEGRGVGRALMAAAESWARERGWRLLSLNVFTENHRARELYQRLGYQPDVLKLIKPLR
jgi:ribosomal protein S18 acetylase RimI-like enzyme